MSTASLIDMPLQADSPAQHLRRSTAAVRVCLRWLGMRKTLTPEQKSQAAKSFGAEGDYLSARKKLLDTGHPAYKEVTAVRGRVISYWKSNTLPYPEPGIRLIKQLQVDPFRQQMLDFRRELHLAVAGLERHYAELKAAARRRLGQLYNPSDYPASLEGMFEVDCDFPSVEPPDYLMQLNPAIYEEERQRVAARFEEAVQLAEQAFIGEFAKLISHLAERLADNGDGERKIFRDSAVTNLGEFFGRFRQLSVRSNEDLDRLVDQAHQLVRGVTAQELRADHGLRQHVASTMTQIEEQLEGMIIDQPRRQIIRSGPSRNGGPHAAAH